MQIDLIAGVGPNLIKIASIIEAIEKAKAEGKNIGYRVVTYRNGPDVAFSTLMVPLTGTISEFNSQIVPSSNDYSKNCFFTTGST